MTPPGEPHDLAPDLPDWLRDFFLKRRQVVLMELGHLEELLGMERSVPTKAERRAARRELPGGRQ